MFDYIVFPVDVSPPGLSQVMLESWDSGRESILNYFSADGHISVHRDCAVIILSGSGSGKCDIKNTRYYVPVSSHLGFKCLKCFCISCKDTAISTFKTVF